MLTKDCSQAVLSGTGSTSDDDDDDEADEPVSAAESTPFNDDVDVALMWHLARCSTVIQVRRLDFILLIPRSRSCCLSHHSPLSSIRGSLHTLSVVFLKTVCFQQAYCYL